MTHSHLRSASPDVLAQNIRRTNTAQPSYRQRQDAAQQTGGRPTRAQVDASPFTQWRPSPGVIAAFDALTPEARIRPATANPAGPRESPDCFETRTRGVGRLLDQLAVIGVEPPPAAVEAFGRAVDVHAELVGTAGLADQLQAEAEAGLGDLNAAELLGHFGTAGGTTRDAARRAATHTKIQLRAQVVGHYRAAWLALHTAGPDLFTAAQAAAEAALERQLSASLTHVDGASSTVWDAALDVAGRLRGMGAIPAFPAGRRAPRPLKATDPSWWTQRPDLVEEWRCEGARLSSQDAVRIVAGRQLVWFSAYEQRRPQPTLADIAANAGDWSPGLLDADQVLAAHRAIANGQWQHLRR